MAHGVPARDIVAFDTGVDTVGSLRVVAGVMRDLGWSAATVVTDPAHAARAQATASAYGIDAHLSPDGVGPGHGLTSEYVGRETLALLRYYARDPLDAPRDHQALTSAAISGRSRRPRLSSLANHSAATHIIQNASTTMTSAHMSAPASCWSGRASSPNGRSTSKAG